MENVDEQHDGTDAGGLTGSIVANRYRVARVVSAGANTIILDAIDRSSDSQVTLKIVRPELASDADFHRKFLRLAEVSHALTHPNIASVLDWGEAELDGEPTVFWVVDALGGGSLRDLLDRGRLLAPGQALVVGLETCRALDAAHQKGLFHTELTPSKMVFGVDRRLRVVDFGMARLLAESAWADASAVPTHVARYASPEQALGLPIDAKTDVYALALVMIEAVTGSVPFAADSTVATLAGRVDKLLPVSADLGALASLLERAGRPESADRFTAAEFGRALVQAAPKLPKPEPIPILKTGTFDTTALRRPSDPTGGIERPAPAAGLAGVDESGAAAPLAVSTVPLPPEPTPPPPPPPPVSPVPTIEPEPDADAESVTHPMAESDDLRILEPEADDDLRIVEPESDSEALPPTEAIESTAVMEPTAVMETTAVSDTGPVLVDTTVVPVMVSDHGSDLDEPGSDGAPATLFDDERRGRRRGPMILIGIVLIAGIAALGYAATLLFATKTFEVPVLAGVSDDEALNQIAGNDWEIEIQRERSDSFPALDTVIRTIPAAGTQLDEGEPFTLVISDGPEFRTLPELDGLPFEAAVAQLNGLGLSGVESPTREFSETVPTDSVIAWQVQGDADATMRAGAQILPGNAIEMTLSKGPEPRSVPDLAGTTIDEAGAALTALQLTVVQGEDVFSDTVPAGAIVVQTPAPGESVARDSAVTVQVSKGPDVSPFPDLAGLSYTDAQARLAESGFAIASLLGTTQGTFVEATIDGAPVAAGDSLRRGTAVDLIFL